MQSCEVEITGLSPVISTSQDTPSQVITFRLKIILNNLVHTNQTSYLKGRYIGENIHLIEDVLHYTDLADISSVLLIFRKPSIP